MPTFYSHTHLQAAQADTQTKACKRVCLPNSTTNRQLDDRKEQRRHYRCLAQWRVTWLIEHSTSHQLLWYIDSFELRNPPLRQAPNRIGHSTATVHNQTARQKANNKCK